MSFPSLSTLPVFFFLFVFISVRLPLLLFIHLSSLYKNHQNHKSGYIVVYPRINKLPRGFDCQSLSSCSSLSLPATPRGSGKEQTRCCLAIYYLCLINQKQALEYLLPGLNRAEYFVATCLSVCLSFYLFVCLFVSQLFLLIYLFVCLSIVCFLAYLFICLPVSVGVFVIFFFFSFFVASSFFRLNVFLFSLLSLSFSLIISLLLKGYSLSKSAI